MVRVNELEPTTRWIRSCLTDVLNLWNCKGVKELDWRFLSCLEQATPRCNENGEMIISSFKDRGELLLNFKAKNRSFVTRIRNKWSTSTAKSTNPSFGTNRTFVLLNLQRGVVYGTVVILIRRHVLCITSVKFSNPLKSKLPFNTWEYSTVTNTNVTTKTSTPTQIQQHYPQNTITSTEYFYAFKIYAALGAILKKT